MLPALARTVRALFRTRRWEVWDLQEHCRVGPVYPKRWQAEKAAKWEDRHKYSHTPARFIVREVETTEGGA